MLSLPLCTQSWYVYFRTTLMIVIVLFLMMLDGWMDGAVALFFSYKIYLLFLVFSFLFLFFWQRSIKWKSMPAIYIVHKSDVTMNAVRPLFSFSPSLHKLIVAFYCCGQIIQFANYTNKMDSVALTTFSSPTMPSTTPYLCAGFHVVPWWIRAKQKPSTSCSCSMLINCLTAEIIFPN